MMNKALHILGADIPHHNRTFLRFFNDQLAPQLAAKSGEKPLFWVVSQTAMAHEFPALSLTIFPTKWALAKALVWQAVKNRRNPAACWRFFGQYNPWIWLAILVGILPASRCTWHVWGADLYETAQSLGFRLFYPLRRLAQRNIAEIWATQGDLHYLRAQRKRQGKNDRLLYFPTQFPAQFPAQFLAPQLSEKPTPQAGRLTILLGNSGDPSNQHLQGLTHIRQTLGEQVKLMMPMGYPANNHAYIEQVRQQALSLFPAENVQILTENLRYDDYLALLRSCDLGYFLFERQQGIGTICLLTAMNIPVLLHPSNPFRLDMQQAGLPFVALENCTLAEIAQTAAQLAQCDKRQIAFFPPNYLNGWQQAVGFSPIFTAQALEN